MGPSECELVAQILDDSDCHEVERIDKVLMNELDANEAL